ncbi:MAG: endonuclease III [Oscillospiraceae bacterium]
MTKKERAKKIVYALENEYPLAECTLDYENAWQLVVSVRLAAQCTDARVNIVTQVLFDKYPSAKALAAAEVADIEEIVRPCGLGASKARDISKAMRMLVGEYGGVVPDDLDELLKIPGVGRKSANLIVGDVYGKPAVVCDTHCIRLCGRFGLTDGTTNPASVENQLRAILPMDKANDFCHRLVLHGRAVCMARGYSCDKCCLTMLCKNAFVLKTK